MILILRILAAVILVVGVGLTGLALLLGGIVGLLGLLVAVSATVGFAAGAEALSLLMQIRDALQGRSSR